MFSKELRMMCFVAGVLFASGTMFLLGLGINDKDVIYCGFGFAVLLVVAAVAPGAFKSVVKKIGNRICKGGKNV